MKTMRNSIITKAVIITAVLLMVPMMAMARGNSEQSYPQALETEFNGIAVQLEAGDIDRTEALERLHEFRAENKKENNEDYQAMEQLLTKVQLKEMTATQAREQAQLLEECKEQQPAARLETQTQTQTQTQTKVQNTSPEQIQTGSGNSAGSSTGGSSDKSKGKK